MTGSRRWCGGAWAVVPALAFALALAGCHRAPRPTPPPPIPDDGGAFTVAESMLDTWNTIGQVLVRLDGVEYLGRAQMLGLYDVNYRGEHFLVRARALPLETAGQGLRTHVDALARQGGAYRSEASFDLLQQLAQTVPVEVARYRQPVRLPGEDKR
ncbi:hypothetical protein [Luteimonas lutimaris]|uniref:hypothetical protein n=1 Tax=Luteimonas lutimaris TaxID=698645 RepID=UPI002D3FFD9F|nr:hypothetical protein [Luteimonas sp.]